MVDEGVLDGPRLETGETEIPGKDDVDTDAEIEGHTDELAVALGEDDKVDVDD